MRRKIKIRKDKKSEETVQKVGKMLPAGPIQISSRLHNSTDFMRKEIYN